MSSVTGSQASGGGGGSPTTEVIYGEIPNYISIADGASISIDDGGALGIKLDSFSNNQGMVVDTGSHITIKGI